MSKPGADKPRFIYYAFGDDGVVRYVGCSVNPRTRLYAHISYANADRKRGHEPWPIGKWILDTRAAGRKVFVCTVRRAEPGREDADEQREIGRLLDAGAPLLNVYAWEATVRPRERRKIMPWMFQNDQMRARMGLPPLRRPRKPAPKPARPRRGP